MGMHTRVYIFNDITINMHIQHTDTQICVCMQAMHIESIYRSVFDSIICTSHGTDTLSFCMYFTVEFCVFQRAI